MRKIGLLFIGLLLGTIANAQMKIAHVDSKKILDTLPSRKAAIRKLDSLNTAGVDELQLLNADFEKAYQIYVAKKDMMSPVEQQIQENKLMQKQKNLEETQASLEESFKLMSEALNKPILDRVQKAIEIVADRKKLNYVIDVTATLYSKSGVDITNEVIVDLLLLDAEAMKKP